MLQSLRTLKLRIRGIENTRKITNAMEMVSSAKLNRVKNKLYSQRAYFTKLENALHGLLEMGAMACHPLLEKRDNVKNITLCVITSDAGLCSVYNYSIIRLAENFINEHGRDRVQLVTVGRDGFNYFKNLNFNISNSYLELYGRYSSETANDITKELAGKFLRKESDEVYTAYTYFTSTLRHKPTVEKLLNIDYTGKSDIDYILEPGAERVLSALLSDYIHDKLRLIILNAFTSEHAARMIAMKSATDNAKELLETLTLLRNKARQAAVTKEVLEIAMSAEALKG